MPAAAPANLPVGNESDFTFGAMVSTEATVGYASQTESALEVAPAESEVEAVDNIVTEKENPFAADMQELEEQAHSRNILLSGDAARHFISACHQGIDRKVFLDQLIVEAKVTYPSEDGWVVLNHERMQELIKRRRARSGNVDVAGQEIAEPAAPMVVSTPELDKPATASSLAEAIMTRDVSLAYKLISNRPMVALADAAADFDALYRHLHGEERMVSSLLKRQAEEVEPAKIGAIIKALTSALDGTYEDEHTAVKLSVMKAVQELA